jgi:hypothetical protein
MEPYIQVEVTDTYSGEANYSWVKRFQLDIRPGESQLALIRRVKKTIGWSGIRCAVTGSGDFIDIRPAGACLVAFVTWEERWQA